METVLRKIGPIHQKPKQSNLNATNTAVPLLHWCKHYYSKGTHNIIPDGASCCFRHWVGLPTRFGIRHPYYDYQEEVLDKIDEGKKWYWILKSPKLGMTEFWITWAIHKALIDDTWHNGQVAIVVATHGPEAQSVIQRCKGVMDNPYNSIDYTQKTNNVNEFYLNNVHFRAHPSMNIEAIRSKPNMKLIFLDEAAMFMMVDDGKVREAAEHYIGGSDAFIVMVSTAGENPGGMFYDIGEEKDSIYEQIRLINPYEYGAKPHPESGTTIYDIEQIELLQQKSRSYARNYLGQFGAGAGNIFSTAEVTEISSKAYPLLSPADYTSACMVDPAYGTASTKTSSKFAILGMYVKDGIVYTDYAKELQSPSDSEGKEEIAKAMTRGYKTLLIDGHYTGLIKDFKKTCHCLPVYFNEKTNAKATGKIVNTSAAEVNTDIRDANTKMINIASDMVSSGKVRIHPDHTHLIAQLKAIRYNEKGSPDKKQFRFDLGDCFRMGCSYLYRARVTNSTVMIRHGQVIKN